MSNQEQIKTGNIANTTPLGIIGTGLMGTALAQCLLSSGRQVIVWNRSSDKTKTAEDAGAVVAQSIPDLLARVDKVIMTVVGDAEMQTATQLLVSAGDDLRDKTIIQWTSHDPSSALQQSELVKKLGGKWIGGAMMTDFMHIGTEKSLLLLSGASKEVFEDVHADLKVLGSLKYFGVDAGRASLYDTAVMMNLFFGFWGHTMALALVRNAFGDIEVYTDLAMQVVPAFYEHFHRAASANVLAQRFDDPEHFAMPVVSAAGAMKMWVGYAQKVNVRAELIEAIDGHFDAMLASNPALAGSDISVIAQRFGKNA